MSFKIKDGKWKKMGCLWTQHVFEKLHAHQLQTFKRLTMNTGLTSHIQKSSQEGMEKPVKREWTSFPRHV